MSSPGSNPPLRPSSSRPDELSRRIALLVETVAKNPLIPHAPTIRQAEFLGLLCLEALYGGSAGGGKSDALLMGALQFAEVPGYAALLLRRKYTDLALPGALMDRARTWLRGKARWNGTDHRWTFRSGAALQFGYLDDPGDHERYQSSEFQYIGLDEATQFRPEHYRYMFSRLRRGATSGVPLRFRAASNPGGPGHDFIKERFGLGRAGNRAVGTGRVFIPASLDDNPHLDRASYVRSLAELDPLTRAQLLAGDWDAYAGGRFHRDWFGQRYRRHGTGFVVGERIIPWEQTERFATVDPAASSKETAKSADPDYTVCSAWAITPRNELLWLDCVRLRREIPDIVPEIDKVYRLWDLSYVGIETVAANRAVYQIAKRSRMLVRELSPRGVDKLVRATPAIVLAESGRIWLPVSAPWVEDALGELLRYTGDEKVDAHDDVVDTVSYAARLLAEKDDVKQGFRPYVVGG